MIKNSDQTICEFINFRTMCIEKQGFADLKTMTRPPGKNDFAKGACGYFGQYSPASSNGAIRSDGMVNGGAKPKKFYKPGGKISFKVQRFF